MTGRIKEGKGKFFFPFAGQVAKKGEFPTGRKAACCSEKVRAGEPVLVVHRREADNIAVVVLHARCAADVLLNLPPDPRDIQSRYDRIRHKLQENHTQE